MHIFRQVSMLFKGKRKNKELSNLFKEYYKLDKEEIYKKMKELQKRL